MSILCADQVDGGGGPPPPPDVTCCADPVDTIVAASPSRLVDIDTTSVVDWPDGIAVWVRSVEEFFILNRSTSLVADGITVADPLVGGGQWLRRNVPSQRWLRQATWFIDSVSGDDENVGDVVGSPLRTHLELERRAFGHGKLIRQNTVVEVSFPGLDPDVDRIKVDVKLSLGVSITYNGVPDAALLRSGTLTGATATDVPTQTQQLIEDTVGGPFTAEVNQRIRMTSGAASGAIAWIAADLDPGVPDTARTTGFAAPTTAPVIVRPGAGDTYVVEALPTAVIESVRAGPADTFLGVASTGVVFNNFELFTGGPPVTLPLPTGPFEFCSFIGCKLSIFNAHDFTGTVALSAVNGATFFKCEMAFLSTLHLSAFGGGPSQLWSNCKLSFGAECVAQNGPLFDRGSLFTIPIGSFGSSGCDVEFLNVGGEPLIAACSTFDSVTDGMDVSEDMSLLFRAPYFGDGNTGVGIRMTGKGWYQVSPFPGVKPSVTGTGGDTDIGGIAKAYAGGIPFFNASNGAQLTEMAETP